MTPATADPLHSPQDPSPKLLDTLFEIERLRGTTARPSGISANTDALHALYSRLSGLASARIEGNRTTVIDAVTPSRSTHRQAENLREIDNLETATEWVSQLPVDQPIDHRTIRHLHTMVIAGLTREGDLNPGSYRSHPVRIDGAEHTPPPPAVVHAEMEAVIEAANTAVAPRHQIAHIAATHHLFSWVHPFGNGNGRVGRLLTLWQLRRNGFTDVHGLPLSPTAIFGRRRTEYYDALASADTGTVDGRTAWTEFFADGMLADMQRLATLHDHDTVTEQILYPALDHAQFAGKITPQQRQIVEFVWERGVVKSADLEPLLTGSAVRRSQKIRDLREHGLIESLHDGPRHYRVALQDSPITPHLIHSLNASGLIPPLLQD
ncbi:MAG: hypothetical protein RL431_81 [Actinomycetota bacterium]